jgi:hypothetical protein
MQTHWHPGSCSSFERSACGSLLSIFYHFFPLLLVVLSAYSEGPQPAKPPDPLDLIVVTVCPNSSCVKLGVLAPVLLQNEAGVFKFVLPPNGVFRVVNVNCQLSNGFKTVMHYVLAVTVQSSNILISALIHGAEKSA